jgi:hypothetical protein
MSEKKGISPFLVPVLVNAGALVLGAQLLALDVFGQRHGVIGWVCLVQGAFGLLALGITSAIIDAGRAVAPLPEPEVTAGQTYRDVVHLEPDARAPKMRLVIAGVVVALVIAQALIPLRYYLGDDKYDERFAWRMFSAVRMHECRVGASEVVNGTPRPVPLASTIHEAWQTTLERNREAAIAGYLSWRCEQEGVESARVENTCVSPSGEPVPPVVTEITCSTGEVRREGGIR